MYKKLSNIKIMMYTNFGHKFSAWETSSSSIKFSFLFSWYEIENMLRCPWCLMLEAKNGRKSIHLFVCSLLIRTLVEMKNRDPYTPWRTFAWRTFAHFIVQEHFFEKNNLEYAGSKIHKMKSVRVQLEEIPSNRAKVQLH